MRSAATRDRAKEKPITEHYVAGYVAFQEGKSADACPHPCESGSSAKRVDWFTGFFDRRTEEFLAYLDRKYLKLETPPESESCTMPTGTP
jgi:hypothetical protein